MSSSFPRRPTRRRGLRPGGRKHQQPRRSPASSPLAAPGSVDSLQLLETDTTAAATPPSLPSARTAASSFPSPLSTSRSTASSAFPTARTARTSTQRRTICLGDTVIPRLHFADAPTTKLASSPLQDTFVLSAGKGDFEDVGRRLARGQEIDALHSALRYTAVHAAADKGQAEMIRLLADNGARLDLQHQDSGNTPLHFAVASGHDSVVAMLIDMGCDPLVCNLHGMRPLEVAIEFRRVSLIRMLAALPGRPTQLTVIDTSRTTVHITWPPPFEDGVWVDKHEVHVVRLPDSYLPGGNAKGDPAAVVPAAQRRESWMDEADAAAAAAAVAAGAPPSDPFLKDAVGSMYTLVGGHHPAHMLVGLAPYTSFRVRVRVHTIRGWSGYSPPLVCHTKAVIPEPVVAPRIVSHFRSDVNVSWREPRANGAPILAYGLEVLSLEHEPTPPATPDSAADASPIKRRGRRRRRRRRGDSAGRAAVAAAGAGTGNVSGSSRGSSPVPLSPPSSRSPSPSSGGGGGTGVGYASRPTSPSPPPLLPHSRSVVASPTLLPPPPRPRHPAMCDAFPYRTAHTPGETPRSRLTDDVTGYGELLEDPPEIFDPDDPYIWRWRSWVHVERFEAAHDRNDAFSYRMGQMEKIRRREAAKWEAKEAEKAAQWGGPVDGEDAGGGETSLSGTASAAAVPAAGTPTPTPATTTAPEVTTDSGSDSGRSTTSAATIVVPDPPPGPPFDPWMPPDPTTTTTTTTTTTSVSQAVNAVVAASRLLVDTTAVSGGDDRLNPALSSDAGPVVLGGSSTFHSPIQTVRITQRWPPVLQSLKPELQSPYPPRMPPDVSEWEVNETITRGFHHRNRPSHQEEVYSDEEGDYLLEASGRLTTLDHRPPSSSTTTTSSVSPLRRMRRRANRPGADAPPPPMPTSGGNWVVVATDIPADTFTFPIRGLMSERDIKIRVLCRNAFGWSPVSADSALYWLPPVPRLRAATATDLTVMWKDHSGGSFQVQYQAVEADSLNGAPLAWRTKPSTDPDRPGFRYLDASETHLARDDAGGPWRDAFVDPGGSDTAVATPLLPFTRYRFRMRVKGVVSGMWPTWDRSSLSDWYMTTSAPPDQIQNVYVTGWTPTSMMVQWKLSRINGSSITHIRVERMRKKVGRDDDSDTGSESSSSSEDFPIGLAAKRRQVMRRRRREARNLKLRTGGGRTQSPGAGGLSGGSGTDSAGGGRRRLGSSRSNLLTAALRASSPALQSSSSAGATGRPGSPSMAASIASIVSAVSEASKTSASDGQSVGVVADKAPEAPPPPKLYDTWTLEADEIPVQYATAEADKVTAAEDIVVSKVYAAHLDDRDAVLAKMLAKKGFGLSQRLVRSIDALTRSRALSMDDYKVLDTEPDAAWIVTGLRPGSHHQYRVSVLNDDGWSQPSVVSPLTRMTVLRPERPEPPIVLPFSPNGLLIAWAFPRSNGAPVSKWELQRLEVAPSAHPDEPPDPFAAEEEREERSLFNGPYKKAHRKKLIRWTGTFLPTIVAEARRVFPALNKRSAADNAAFVLRPGVQLTVPQLQALWDKLPASRPWTCHVIIDLFPTSKHAFRCTAANTFGRSKRSKPSLPGIVADAVAVKPLPPIAQASGSTSMMLFWIEPHHNGAAVEDFVVERQRVWAGGSEDSDSEVGENDTDQWVTVKPPILAAASARAAQAIDVPDLPRLLKARGRRRFGRRMGYAVQELRAGKAYRFRLTARNAVGNSACSDRSAIVRTKATIASAALPPVVMQHTPRTLRVCWNPPRSNGSLINMVLLVRQQVPPELAADYLQEHKDKLAGTWVPKQRKPWNVKLEDTEEYKAEVAVQLECDARMMHPDSVSVLKRRPVTGVAWVPVDLPVDQASGVPSHPRPPNAAAVAALPVSPHGQTLLGHRQWVEFVVDDLVPETHHRFKLRYRNQRGWGDWSEPSLPVEVFPDWPKVIEDPPFDVLQSPYSLFLTWPEPDGNGSIVTSFKLQRKRIRFKPKDLEPHPDDSDSAPEDGNWDEPWQDVAEIPAYVAREFGLPETAKSYERTGGCCKAVPSPEDDRVWADKFLADLQARFDAGEVAARDTSSDRGQVGFLVQGLRPGTRHLFRASAANYLGYPPFSIPSVAAKTDPVNPEAPPTPVAETNPSDPTTVLLKFRAPRCNGAEIFCYEIWRRRLRGGPDPDDSDSDPDSELEADQVDTAFIEVLSATPDDTTTKQVWQTSGHSGDHLCAVIEELRPGSRHEFMIQSRSNRGLSVKTAISNVGKALTIPPGHPTRPLVYMRSAFFLHFTWSPGRSNGGVIQQVEIQRRRMKGKPDRGMPSDDELDMIVAGVEKVRRRVQGDMSFWVEGEWETTHVLNALDVVRPPPAEPVSQYVARQDVVARVRGIRAGSWVPDDVPVGMTRTMFSYTSSEVLLPASTHEFRVRASNVAGWSEWSPPSFPMTCLSYAPFPPGRPYVGSMPSDPVIFDWVQSRNNGRKVQAYELWHKQTYPMVGRGGEEEGGEEEGGEEEGGEGGAGAGAGADTSSASHFAAEPKRGRSVEELKADGWEFVVEIPGSVTKHRTTYYQASIEERMVNDVVKRLYSVRCRNTHGWSEFSESSEIVVYTSASVFNDDGLAGFQD